MHPSPISLAVDDCCCSQAAEETANNKQMKQSTIAMLTIALLITVLFGLVSSKPSPAANYHHGTDIVTEILQSIDRREEMWKITNYLNASREELAKALPLVSPGKYLVCKYQLTQCLIHLTKPFSSRWDENQLHIFRSDVECLCDANSARRHRSAG